VSALEGAGRSKENLVQQLRAEVARVVGSAVPTGSRCALVGFPSHENPGDSVIWLGIRIILDQLDVTVAFVCDMESYSPEALAALLGDGTILLTGGGNLGDLWPGEQELRERVFEDFPETSIVQLPQSIHFEDRENLARFRQLVERREDVVLLVRENQSLARARDELGVDAILCPDVAFLVEPPLAAASPETDVLWIARDDKESRRLPRPQGADGVVELDWRRFGPDESRPVDAIARAHELGQAALRAAAEAPAELPALQSALAEAYDWLARHRTERAFRILEGGRVLISDRLHVHILALMVGLPHVVLDNRYGKLRSTWETWTSGSELARWADTPEDALELAAELLVH